MVDRLLCGVRTAGLEFGLPATGAISNISDIIQSSRLSQLVKGKS